MEENKKTEPVSNNNNANTTEAKQERKPREKKPEKEKKPQEKKQQPNPGKKGEKTGLGVEAKKEVDFPAWYSQVITLSEMIEYYDVSGCYILRPWAYFMWEQIKDFFDAEIKKLGVQNAYFPLFVSKAALEKEKNHIEGFAPEVAWVTKSGDSDLAEPIAVRPTSETIMYPAYAKWIRSHRDLPLKINQWCNVVRWEFKHPTPFLRSREFLWQEGHTVFAKKEEADAEVLDILELYKRVFEEYLAVPVIKGKKSEDEKFAGGLYTTTVEAFIPAMGRGVQGATSHCLGQNFSKMFDIQFENEKEEKVHAWQNSWGLTTRTIGVMIMVHSDNKGLVLPPKMAPIQIVIIPITLASQDESEKALQLQKCEEFRAQFKAAGFRVQLDDRPGYSPGFKYNHWELRGIPVRVELGPKDVKEQTVVVARRDTGEKIKMSWSDVVSRVPEVLTKMQSEMLERAREERDRSIKKVDNWDSFLDGLDAKNILLTPWCDQVSCEVNIKKKSAEAAKARAAGQEGQSVYSSGAKTLCLPFVADELPSGAKCFCCGSDAKVVALWGRSF